jgi:hypothetical protein
MDTFEIVRNLRRISEVKHKIARPRFLFDRTVADAQISLDSDCTGPYPSSSSNTVAFFGTEAPINAADAEALIDVYRSRGVKRFFVFMSPSPWFQQNIEALSIAGLTPFRGPEYHTLVRSVSEPVADAAACDFRIERMTADSWHSSNLLEPGTSLAVRMPECDVWVAMDGDTVAGYGQATTVGSVTYLGGAGTSEPYRKRGAQTAIIRARLHDAARRGSEIAVSETLSMLGSSLRNLQRAGFRIAYDKIVYQYNAG